MEVDWASAPEDILECIVKKFQSIDEYILFGSVCRSWNHIIQQQKPWQELALGRPPQLPLLAVPSEDGRRDIRKLYNVFDGKTYTLPLTVRYNRRCVGSSHGWLAVFRRTMGITLINPTSALERRIVLPPIMKRPKCKITRESPFTFYCWVTKVVLSHDPDLVPPQHCMVAVLSGTEHQMLAFMRLSDQHWTFIDYQFDLLDDVLFCDGLLYAANLYGLLISVDLDLAAGEKVDNKVNIVVPTFFDEQTYKVYILKSITGDILLVRRSVGGYNNPELPPEYHSITRRFDVYRLEREDGSGGDWRWIEVKSLDNEVLFVGDNESMSFSCGDDIGSYCKPNSIYYTDNAFDDGHYREFGPIDVGVYHLEDGSFDKTYILNPSEKNFPPPIFIVPKLFSHNK